MRLMRSTSHGIRILLECAGDEQVTIKRLSEVLDLTESNVTKIIGVLTRARLVNATRGRLGGVRLSRPAEAISIGEVVSAIEGVRLQIEEVARDRRRAKTVNGMLDAACDAFVRSLHQYTVAEMAKVR